MKMFWCLEGCTGAAHRYDTIEAVTKAAQKQAARGRGEEVVILQAYATAELPITGVVITPIVAETK